MLGSSSTSGQMELPQSASTSNQDPRLSLPDSQLHDTLLNIYRNRVDPLVRILHWPTFLEQSKAFRQGVENPTEGASNPQYSSNYFLTPGYTAQQGYYSNMPITSSQGENIYAEAVALARTDGAFVGLLYTVYYSAVISMIDAPTPPELGTRMDLFELARAFKKEIGARVMTNDRVDSRSTIPLLQAMVLALVSHASIIAYKYSGH